jgi:hypothetical protein
MSTGASLRLVLDHDEAKFAALAQPCTYVIVVINPSADQRALYKLTTAHTQNNHLLVQEGTPHIDSVEIRTYKYFKFTLLEDSANIDNVTIEVAPLHGDSDLFVSRNDSEQFPTKDTKGGTRKSQRIGSLVDHIVFARAPSPATGKKVAANDSTVASVETSGALVSLPSTVEVEEVNGTYYIGVYGYSYTTFSLLVTVHRAKGHRTSQENLLAVGTTLLEGFPMTKSLHNELDFFFGHFQVDIAEEDDHSILIDVHNMEGRTKTYVKLGDVPTIFEYDMVLNGETSAKITPKDRYYNKTGTYYIVVFSDFGFFDLFRDNYYTFSLTWRRENTVPHLNSQVLHAVVTAPNNYTLLRHYVQEDTSGGDIRLSLLSSAGNQDLYVTVGNKDKDGKKRRPSNETYDFTTKFMQGGNYMNGKALLLPMMLL